MQAIILAGGFGTRLRSVIADLPKPLAPIHGKPFLAYLLDYLQQQGIQRVILSVHYMHEKIVAYFGTAYQGMVIDYAVEETPLGTGGAILLAMQKIDRSRPVFVLNGDTFLKLNYSQLATYQASALAMTLRSVQDTSRYGVVVTEKDRVVAFQEKGNQGIGLINAGVYYIQPNLFDGFTLPNAFSFEKDFLFPYVATLKPQAMVVDDYFIDIGVPDDYQQAILDFV